MTHAQLRSEDPELEHESRNSLPSLVLAALGVVYGDIGTSPLYAFREALHATAGRGSHNENVLGILSLIVWALTIVVTVKYVTFVLKADNRGEGGTLSLMSLARQGLAGRPAWILILGVAGASLFLGDAIITPAISVLSAVEGIQIVAPALSSWIVPITLTIIAVLFFVQRFGTGGVASVFGPVMALWFVVLGATGAIHILDDPAIFQAINPIHAIRYAIENIGITVTVLGAVFLAVTGAEALYVDLGHFGRKPIVTAWFALLANPEMAAHPFFGMHPDWAKIPMVCLATAATVIASQAVISGAYSLVRQAMHLNLLPRLQILHTSETHSGQIFMPQVNSFLFIFVVGLVLFFRNSSGLSAAYGIAVTGEMLITSVLLYVVMLRIWKWAPTRAAIVIVPLFLIDAGFFAANVAKFADGGWVPVAVACTMGLIMQTWMSGRRLLAARTKMDEIPLASIIDRLSQKPPPTVPGTAIFLTSDVEGAPTALLHSLKHYKVLHQHNVILSVVTAATPFVPDDEKIFLESFNPLFSRLIITFGYMETPNIPRALVLVRKLGLKFDIMSTSFFLSRRTILPSKRGGMPFWQDRLFITLAQNAGNATDYFGLPSGRVVELGLQTII